MPCATAGFASKRRPLEAGSGRHTLCWMPARARRFDIVDEPMLARVGAQGLVEYRLIIALVAVLAIAGLLLFGPQLSSLLSQLAGSV